LDAVSSKDHQAFDILFGVLCKQHEMTKKIAVLISDESTIQDFFLRVNMAMGTIEEILNIGFC
jgi:hypothetical protein